MGLGPGGLGGPAPTEHAWLGPALLVGFGVVSAGGPLAIMALYLPQSAGLPARDLFFGLVGGVICFLPALWVWASYSARIASAGGLYAFVREAAGPRWAGLQAILWALSYFLYLPYTVTYVVFYLLPWIFPSLPRVTLDLAEVALPVGIFALVWQGRRATFVLLAASAMAQVVAVGLLGFAFWHGGGIAYPAPPPLNLPVGLAASARISTLFVCLSLLLFLGGETRGGAPAVRRALLVSFTVAAVVSLFGAWLLTGGVSGSIPGVGLARLYAGRTASLALGLGVVASVVSLIVAEYVSLSRLWHSASGIAVDRAVRWIGFAMVTADVISLAGPRRFYVDLLPPSLVALFLSQLVAFAAHPLFARRYSRVAVPGLMIVALACAWAIYGLLSVFGGAGF